jgi:hypothetical protein
LKAILFFGLVLLCGCTAAAPRISSSPSPLATAAAVEATKGFWKAYTGALGSGEMEPMKEVCEGASQAWAHTLARVVENRRKGVLTAITSYQLTNFKVSIEGSTTKVSHRLDWRGQMVSSSTRSPLEPEQALPALRATVELERFGNRLLVTDFQLDSWQ